MKKFLLLFLLGIFASQAKALTVDDLCGKIVAQRFSGNYIQQSLCVGTYYGYFEKVSSTQVKLVNFYGLCDLTFTLSNNQLILTGSSRGVTSTKNGTTYTFTTQYGGSWSGGNNGNTYVSARYFYCNRGSNYTSTTVQSLTGDTGGYYFLFEMPLYMQESGYSGRDYLNYVHLYVYEGNAVETLYTSSGSAQTDVFVSFNTTSSGNFQVYNWGRSGWTTINSGVGTNSAAMSANGCIQGTIDYSTGKITIPYQKGNCKIKATWSQNASPSGGYKLTSNSGEYHMIYANSTRTDVPVYLSSSSKGSAIIGEFKELGFSHDAGTNPWTATDGGTRTTGDIIFMDFSSSPWGWYRPYDSNYSGYTGSTITYNRGDVTHQAYINLTNFAWQADKGINFTGKITGIVNPQYVESYDIFLVKGRISSVASKTVDATTGLSGAMLLGEAYDVYNYEEWAQKAVAADGDLTFKKYVPVADLNAAGISNSDSDYTVFLRANYTAASGLTPTFHALTSPTSTIITALDEVDAPKATIAVEGNEVVVSDTDADVEIYTAAGAQVYAGAERRVALAPGVYVVRCNTQAQKVVIR